MCRCWPSCTPTRWRAQREADQDYRDAEDRADYLASRAPFRRCENEGPNGQCDQDARTDHRCTRKGNPIEPDTTIYTEAI